MPDTLSEKRLISFLGGLLAGAKYGEFEERLKSVLKRSKRATARYFVHR